MNIFKWGFPEIAVPPNHPLIDGIFHEINHPAMGVPHLWKPSYGNSDYFSKKNIVV